jgi:hypothetical protein
MPRAETASSPGGYSAAPQQDSLMQKLIAVADEIRASVDSLNRSAQRLGVV